jgi:hypothetical protein
MTEPRETPRRITKLVGTDADRRLVFWCPGCEEPHMPRVQGAVTWTWNGDRIRPTLTPSILVSDSAGARCHSYVTDGQIQFLGDCTHALAGQTVPIPDWPYRDDEYGGLNAD